MKNRIFSVVLLLALLVTLTSNVQARPISSSNPTALVYVRLASADDITRFASTGLPMFINLDEGLLTGADLAGQGAIKDAGLSFQVLDPVLSTGSYYLAVNYPSRTAPDYASFGQVLLRLGSSVLLKLDPAQVSPLTQAGAELQQISLTPKPFPTAQVENPYPEVVEPDPVIQGMIDQVSQTQVYTYDRQLAGELPVWVDNAWYTISTRYTYSGEPIQKTTSFVGQHMASLGLDVEYHNWGGSTYPNVIGQISGSVNPDDVFIIGGHIDDVQGAPGADDNASGSVAALIAADIMSQYQWGCTLRFAFWTGEEQGLNGSNAYAYRAYQQGENIVGYENLDMIAWNTIGSSPDIYLGYDSSVPGSYALATLFSDVVDTYNINLIPTLGTQWRNSSDHGSFLDWGYPAFLGIESNDDFNPYYHTWQDTPAHTDPVYFTDYVKASVATLAHMTGCLIPPSTEGTLHGQVTAASDGSPLASAGVIADDGQGSTYPTTTDASGYYTLTLPVGDYLVTASADEYVSQTKNASIAGDETTVLDFALEHVCVPLSWLDFTWIPTTPHNGELVTFTAFATGGEPIDFQWSFGDGNTGAGASVDHTYANAGSYAVRVTASNGCSTGTLGKNITVQQQLQKFFLPLVDKP